MEEAKRILKWAYIGEAKARSDFNGQKKHDDPLFKKGYKEIIITTLFFFPLNMNDEGSLSARKLGFFFFFVNSRLGDQRRVSHLIKH